MGSLPAHPPGAPGNVRDPGRVLGTTQGGGGGRRSGGEGPISVGPAGLVGQARRRSLRPAAPGARGRGSTAPGRCRRRRGRDRPQRRTGPRPGDGSPGNQGGQSLSSAAAARCGPHGVGFGASPPQRRRFRPPIGSQQAAPQRSPQGVRPSIGGTPAGLGTSSPCRAVALRSRAERRERVTSVGILQWCGVPKSASGLRGAHTHRCGGAGWPPGRPRAIPPTVQDGSMGKGRPHGGLIQTRGLHTR